MIEYEKYYELSQCSEEELYALIDSHIWPFDMNHVVSNSGKWKNYSVKELLKALLQQAAVKYDHLTCKLRGAKEAIKVTNIFSLFY